MLSDDSKVINAIRDAIGKLEKSVLMYPVDDYAKYREMCGMYQGLSKTLEIMESVLSDGQD
jgi:hypothetical protein